MFYSNSLAEVITNLIAAACMFTDPTISKLKKEVCAEFMVNCVIDYKGELTKDAVRLDMCIYQGKRRLNLKGDVE